MPARKTSWRRMRSASTLSPSRSIPRLRRLAPVELLEQRCLFAGDWQNPVIAADTDDSGFVSLADALVVVTDVRANGNGRTLAAPQAGSEPTPTTW